MREAAQRWSEKMRAPGRAAVAEVKGCMAESGQCPNARGCDRDPAFMKSALSLLLRRALYSHRSGLRSWGQPSRGFEELWGPLRTAPTRKGKAEQESVESVERGRPALMPDAGIPSASEEREHETRLGADSRAAEPKIKLAKTKLAGTKLAEIKVAETKLAETKLAEIKLAET
ncbi:unnamed protein product [Lota lota]